MERIIIEDIFDIAEMMYGNAIDGLHTTFVGFYEDAIALVKDLATFEDISFETIEINPYYDYDKEYYVTLDAEDMTLTAERAYCNEVYLIHEADVLLVADDCNSKILERIDYDTVFEVGYEDDECDGDCENCHLDEPDRHEVVTRVATDESGKLRGFEKSWETKEDGMTYHSTYSFFSSNEKMLRDMLDNFKIKY